ncbi:MAG: hypothetical protein DLM53_07560 [Candidatus Eremiobacter antarcticus]|nr:MAG: hypothetical protein DLM53_07560 [Candidatus Eremiobacter sp. RRmetagenome_bin22]
MARAYARALFCSSLNSGLCSKSDSACSCASAIPCSLPTAELISIQSPQPTRRATWLNAGASKHERGDEKRNKALTVTWGKKRR